MMEEYLYLSEPFTAPHGFTDGIEGPHATRRATDLSPRGTVSGTRLFH
jgi:hypothetical protein